MFTNSFAIGLVIILCSMQFSAAFLKLDIKAKLELKELKFKYADDSPIKVDGDLVNSNNRTLVNINCTLKVPVGQAIFFKLELQLWNNGQWTRNVIKYEKDNPCIQLKVALGSVWHDVEEVGHFGHKCPYPPGQYYLENFYINSTVPIAFAAGKYRLFINVYKQKKWLLEAVAVAEIIQI